MNLIDRMTKISFIILLVTLVGCATGGRKAQHKLRTLASESKITEAIKLVKSKEFFPENHSKLLKLLELGTLYQVSGQYYQSLMVFDKARELSDRLFTKSISKKALSAVTNNNMDNYYGEKYERSLIRFYQALNHFYLYQKGEYEAHVKEKKTKKNGNVVITKRKIKVKKLDKNAKKNHLAAARATILEWDSLLENYKSVIGGEGTYKVDLMAKLFGAFIHEQMATRSDLRIAENLYFDAKKVLFRNYNLYSSFNSKSKKFSKDYSKLPNMEEKTVGKNYVTKTAFSKDLLKFIDSRLSDLKSGNKDNFKVVLQDGYIAEKVAKRIDFPIPVDNLRKVKGAGGDIVSFTTDLLSVSAGTIPTISFELPEIKKKQNKKHIFVVVKNTKGEIVARKPAALVNPMSDIASQTLDSKVISTYAKIGTRLVTKHIAAIGASYLIFKKAGGGLQGKLAAGTAYAAANKAIAASEMADLRYWSTLPHNIRVSSMKLRPGMYELFFEVREGKNIKSVKHRSFTLQKGKTTSLNVNIF